MSVRKRPEVYATAQVKIQMVGVSLRFVGRQNVQQLPCSAADAADKDAAHAQQKLLRRQPSRFRPRHTAVEVAAQKEIAAVGVQQVQKLVVDLKPIAHTQNQIMRTPPGKAVFEIQNAFSGVFRQNELTAALLETLRRGIDRPLGL